MFVFVSFRVRSAEKKPPELPPAVGLTKLYYLYETIFGF